MSNCAIPFMDRIGYLKISLFSTLLWKGITPLNIEVFIWLLLHGRICTKDFLKIKNLIDTRLSGYSFYDFDREIIDHLFLHVLKHERFGIISCFR
jgi:hypothetical protein